MLRVDVKDNNDLRSFLKLFPNNAMSASVKDLRKASNELRNNVIRDMQGTPRLIGRAYRRTKTGKTHHPSAPGFPPAIDSGNYVRGIHAEGIPTGGHTFVTGVPYLDALEDGVPQNNLQPRPVWEKNIDKVTKDLPDDIGVSVARFIKTS